MTDEKNEYGKRPVWQWIAIYLVVGLVVYALIYYVFIAKKGGNGYGAANTNQPANPTSSVMATQNSVQIVNSSFSPASLTVKVGDTVTWTNQDSMGHSATADDNSFDTGVLDQGKSGTVTFSKAGTYTYHCKIHSSMHGTITVQ